MKRQMEKIALLSLSLIVVSTYSVTTVLPSMLGYYTDYSSKQVETLISIPSFAIMIMVLLSPWISKIMKERIMITSGLVLLSLSGMAPMFCQNYSFVFASRVLLGIGIGLINARAVSIISERYEGKEKVTLLGYRSSAETLGNAFLTFLVGRLLLINWTYAFIVYAFGFVILALYIFFVPDREPKALTDKQASSGHFTKRTVLLTFIYALSAACLVSSSSAISLRVPILVLEKGFANETQASVVLSLLLLTGIVAGAVYSKLAELTHDKLFVLSVFLYCAGFGVLIISNSLILLGIGAIICGFAHNVAITCMFNNVSDNLPDNLVHASTSMVLVGCNLGASSTPFIMNAVEKINPSATTAFYTHIGMLLVICIVYTIFAKPNMKSN